MSYPPRATFGPRLLTDFELVWFIRGDCVAYRNSRAVPAPAGTLLLQQPGTRDAYDWATQQTTLHAFIHFGMRPPPPTWRSLAQWPVKRKPPPDGLMLTLFRFILGLHRSHGDTATSTLLPALELLVRLFVTGAGNVPAELEVPLPETVTRVFRWVQARLREQADARFELGHLARQAHVSPQHLCRVFNRALGRGPMECVRLLRIEQAATLIERSDDPVRAIADRCGFASPYHFSRVFRHVYGVPPREYRKRFQIGVQHGIASPRRPAVFGDAALRWLTTGRTMRVKVE
jgi:AraC-like DNA-binding protein